MAAILRSRSSVSAFHFLPKSGGGDKARDRKSRRNAPIRAGNKQVNALLGHQRSDRRITNHRVRSSETRELDGGQARALLVRSRLGKVSVQQAALRVERGDDAEGGAVTLSESIRTSARARSGSIRSGT